MRQPPTKDISEPLSFVRQRLHPSYPTLTLNVFSCVECIQDRTAQSMINTDLSF